MADIEVDSNKKSFKIIEIPLNKFKEEAIPFHQECYEKNKHNIHKLVTKAGEPQFLKEAKDLQCIMSQLGELLDDLDTLADQVLEEDLPKYKKKSVPLRVTIHELLVKYNGLYKVCMAKSCENDDDEATVDDSNQFVDLQIQDNLAEIQLNEKIRLLNEMEEIHGDIQGVQEMFIDLNSMVVQQSEAVDVIEENVEVAEVEVKQGLQQIIKASRYKKASYPILGASIGVIAGGPVGAAIGVKAGLLAAATCAVIGWFTGRFVKTKNESLLEETEIVLNKEVTSEKTDELTVTDKKND